MKSAYLWALTALAACSHHSPDVIIVVPPSDVQSGVVGNPLDPERWEIGPFINGQNLSVGMPLHPAPHAEGFVVDIPSPPASAHYVTMPSLPLAGKSQITMRFRVEGGPLRPVDLPQLTGMLTIYFERAGLCWTAQCETMRWYSVTGRQRPLVAGEYTVVARFDQPWSAVLTSLSTNAPMAFIDSLTNTGRVGFVLGGGNGVGHGVIGPGRIVVKEFRVE